jgi:NADPH:quinone reductase-like Zn-dependent oxidoreductase
MRAVLLRTPGSADALELADIEEPVPTEHEVLVRVRAATVTRGDIALRRVPLKRKRILGHEFAGEIEAVGRAVTRFSPGLPVFGTTTGLGLGSHAEYVCVPDDGVLLTKPTTASFEEAAAVPVGGMTALQLLRKAHLQRGMTVVVFGASGSVGTYAVQLAAHFGAVVTGVCSTPNVELVRSLGASEVIDYTRDGYLVGGKTYDVVVDAVGKNSPVRSRGVLKEGGSYVTVKSLTAERLDDLVALKQLVEQGSIRPVIDRRYPLEQIREAHRYVEAGHKRGNVVITFSE